MGRFSVYPSSRRNLCQLPSIQRFHQLHKILKRKNKIIQILFRGNWGGGGRAIRGGGGGPDQFCNSFKTEVKLEGEICGFQIIVKRAPPPPPPPPPTPLI